MVGIASAVVWLAAGGEPMPQKIFIFVHQVDIPKDGIDINPTTE